MASSSLAASSRRCLTWMHTEGRLEMKTDIVILSKSGDLLDKCLTSIEKHTSSEAVGTIAVGANGSVMDVFDCTDIAVHHSKDSCFDKPFSVEAVEFEQYSYSKLNNVLARDFCKSDFVLFMNDDVELTEDGAVEKCMELLESDPLAGTAGIRLDYPDGSIQHGGIFYAFGHQWQFIGVGHAGFKQRCKMPDMWTWGNTGAFLMLRRADFLEVGGFDEEYKTSFQDVQLCLDVMLKLGKKSVTLNSVSALHKEKQTRGEGDLKEDMTRLAGSV